MNTPNQTPAAAQTPAVPTTIAEATTPATIKAESTIASIQTPEPTVSYPDIDALSLIELRAMITEGIQARPSLQPDSIQELDRRMSYAHLRSVSIKEDRAAAKSKEPAQLRRLTMAEANRIARMCTYGPTDAMPMDQALMEMGLVEFYDDTDSIEQTKLGADCLYGLDRLKYIPAEWMNNEERKRAGL